MLPRPLPGSSRRRLSPRRRLRILRPGGLFVAGTLALGFATLNTGNNLLFLLLGTLLGMILVSGVLAARTLARVSVGRLPVTPLTARRPGRIRYRVRARSGRLGVCAVEIREAGLEGEAFLAFLEPRGPIVTTTAVVHAPPRGLYALDRVTLATAFPFGFFRRERDVSVPGTLLVRPPTDRPIRAPGLRLAAGEMRTARRVSAGADRRGSFRGLRAWRTGDDPRDVHWRTSARLREPVVREFDRESAGTPWLVLDVQGAAPDRGEAAIEIAAALAARFTADAIVWGFAAGDVRLDPAAGTARLETVLDVLARLDVGPDAPTTRLPADPGACVFVTARAAPASDWLDLYVPGES